MPSKDVYRIGITGSYGGLNLGDEAILQSIIMHIFPTTQNLSKIVARKLEQKANADVAEVEATKQEPPPEPPKRITAAAAAKSPVPKTKRAARKAATLPTP